MADPFLSGYLAYGLASSSGGFIELAAGNGYARRPIAFAPPSYGRTADLGGGTLGPCTGADYGMVAMGAVFDAAVAGNMLITFPLPNPAYVAVGGTRTDATGSIALSFSDLDLPTLPRTTITWPAGTVIGVLDGTSEPVTSGVPLTLANGRLTASTLRTLGGSGLWVPVGFRGRGLPGSGYNETNASNSSFQDVTAWMAPAGAPIKALRLGYGGYDVTIAGEVDRAIAVTGAASVQLGTAIYPAKFGGRRQMVVEPMHDVVVSDPINIAIPAGAAFFVRTWGQVTGGTSWWLADYASPQSGSTFLAGEGNARGANLADHTLATFTPGNSGGGFWGPTAIYAMLAAALPAVLILGDSIIAGTGDAADANGRMGFAQRALANLVPWLSLARGSTQASQAVAAGNGRGFYATAVDRGITDVLMQWCRNDLYAGIDAATVRASLQTLAAPYQAAGMRVWAFTCPPSTASTDSWVTAGNQSVMPPLESQRQAYNADLRANWLAYGFAGLVDLASVVEDPASPGLWRTDGGAWTVDGVHPSPIGHAALASLLDPAMFPL